MATLSSGLGEKIQEGEDGACGRVRQEIVDLRIAEEGACKRQTFSL